MRRRLTVLGVLLAVALGAPAVSGAATAAENGPGGQVVAPTAPPPLRAEPVPPGAPGSVWVPGHWYYAHSRWLWVPGRWELAPYPGAVWIPGHWARRPHGWIWVRGHWQGYAVAVGPPAPRVEVAAAPPFAGAIWIGGVWRWGAGRWVWVGGHWARAPWRDAVWVPGHWARHARGWVWIAGYWR